MGKIDKEEMHKIFIGIKNGNELEFNKLYKQYKHLVYGIAFSMLKNKEDSEEIVQIVFMKIFKLEKEKLPTTKETSWIYEVTKNEVMSFFRKKKQEISFEEVYYINNEDDDINSIIDKETYNKIIQKLNQKEQEIVSLKILSKLSFREISKILNIPIGTVQWRYYKAIHTLKLLLSNLSMFIITMTVFVATEVVVKKERNDQTMDEEKEQEKEDVVDNSAQERQETKKDATNITEDVIENITEDTVITTETIKEEESSKLKMSDIGILSISIIFFIFTIIFLIIFIKHQQKLKKKTSK